MAKKAGAQELSTLVKHKYATFEEFLEHEQGNLKEKFDIFDKDGNGQITMEELGSVFRACGQNPTDSDLENIKFVWDKNANGKIEIDDFYLISWENFKTAPVTENELREAFKVFDRDGNGFIDKQELVSIVTLVCQGNTHLCFTEDEIDMMLLSVDLDNDGRINYDEFIKIIQR